MAWIMAQSLNVTRHCSAATPALSPSVSLPVLATRSTQVRKSRTSIWRAGVLVGVHLLIVGHILHWWITGRTLSPVEPSEAMYTLNQGYLNAGFVFFALALLATLLFGRVFCGWGCHIVAYQDLCAWLLRKIGIKVKPFRSRILVLAPLALAIYMFVWPSAYRWFAGASAPTVTNHLMTTEFWKTFPGVGVALLTFAVCGFLIVYVLGGKGFCTYACPYGGFFGLIDQAAVGRIRVTDACEHCGHCTAVCTSNVRVHDEIARFGMVVDPGCMKCMDCISVCPNDALYFGFTAPPLFNRQSPNHQITKLRGRYYDFSFGEEMFMAGVGLFSLLAYRGLYGQIPLLLAMGLAAITAFLGIKVVHMFTAANVKIQNVQLKRGRRLTVSGWGFAAVSVAVFAFVGHSSAVQYHIWQGQRLLASIEVGDEVWRPGNSWWEKASAKKRSTVRSAIEHLEWADSWGLLSTPAAFQDMIWLQLARGDVAAAERIVRRLAETSPKQREVHRGLAGILRKAGRFAEAESAYRKALTLDPAYATARRELGTMLVEERRFDDAIQLFRDGEQVTGSDTSWRADLVQSLMAAGRYADAKSELRAALESNGESTALLAALGVAEIQTGEVDSGIAHLRRVIELDPSQSQVRYNLAIALLSLREIPEAVELLERVVADRPTMAEARYNLAVAIFMSGRPAYALPHAEEALRLSPDDPQAREFITVIRQQLDATPAEPRP